MWHLCVFVLPWFFLPVREAPWLLQILVPASPFLVPDCQISSPPLTFSLKHNSDHRYIDKSTLFVLITIMT